MFELFGPELGGLILLALWVYCIFDVIATDESLVRNVPKGLWLLIVIFLPDIGSLAWLFLGRPQYAGWRPGDTTARPVHRARGPEDDARWTPTANAPPSIDGAARLKACEDDLKRREEELAKKDVSPPDEGEGFTFRW